MDKKVLVINTPENCVECKYAHPLRNGIRTFLICAIEWKELDFIDFLPDWCPLKPLPKKRTSNFYKDEMSMGFKDGFNECLLLITGETE